MVVIEGVGNGRIDEVIYINHPDAATRVRGVVCHRTQSRRKKYVVCVCIQAIRADKVKERLRKKLKEKLDKTPVR